MTRRKKPPPTDPDKALLAEVSAAIELQTPRSVPAGATELIGPQPPWLPADIVDEIAQACENLLATMRQWLAAYEHESAMPPGGALRSIYPFELKDALESLAYAKQIISLGETRGLEQHGRYLQREALRQRKRKLLQRNKEIQGGQRSGKVRRNKTKTRDERIQKDRKAGLKLASIALEQKTGLSESQISRIGRRDPAPGTAQLPASSKDDEPT